MRTLQHLGRELRPPAKYYQYPALKEPGWRWEVVVYIFLGGLSAGSYVVATIAHLFGRKEDREVARVGRYLSLGAIALSPLFLIADLGRPERFLNMLRLVKSRSPMSMGTWGLSGFAVFAGLGALRQAADDGLLPRRWLVTRLLCWIPLSVSGVVGTLFAFFVSSYTGVLLSFTNVPLWAKNYLFQAPLFLTSALSSGLAAISLVLTTTRGVSGVPPWLSWLETAVSAGEAGLTAGSLVALGPTARPLFRGRQGSLFWGGFVGFGLVLRLALRGGALARGVHSSRFLLLLANFATLAGSLMMRAAWVKAGQESARDATAYLAFANRGEYGDTVPRARR